MKEDTQTLKTLPLTSSIDLPVSIEENWFQQLLKKNEFVIPVGDQYQLHDLTCHLAPDMITVIGSIMGKPDSFVEVSTRPVWDENLQRLVLHDIRIQTRTKNLLLKSAAWFASAFLQEKIDQKLEGYLHELYQHQISKISAEPLRIPIADKGFANMEIGTIRIHDMQFLAGRIDVMASIHGTWNVVLTAVTAAD